MRLVQQHFDAVNCVRQYESLQRQEMAEILKISFPTLKNILDARPLANMDTDADGCTPCINYLAAENAKAPVTIKADSAYFLGFSIGVGQTKVCLVDMSFRCLLVKEVRDLFHEKKVDISSLEHESAEESPKRNTSVEKEELYGYCFDTGADLHALCELVNEKLLCFLDLIDAGVRIASVGFAYPGAVDNKENSLDFSCSLKFINKLTPEMLIDPNVYKQLRERDITVAFEHDIKASIVSEKFSMYKRNSTLHYLKDKQNICCLYLGTGVGSGIVLNNQLYRGGNNYSGEIGHIQIPDFYNSEIKSDAKEEGEREEQDPKEKKGPDKKCQCGKTRCFEYLLRQKVFGLNRDDFKTASYDKLMGILEDERRESLFVDYIGFIINLVVNIFDLDAVILTGRLSEIARDQSIWRKIGDKKNNDSMTYFPNYTIAQSVYDRFAPAIGAAICSYYAHHNSPVNWYSETI